MNKLFFGSAALLALLGLFVREGETLLLMKHDLAKMNTN